MAWTAFPFDASAYRYTPTELKKLWTRLHAGDAEAAPAAKAKALWAAWGLFHAGDFEAAAEAGLALGEEGHTVANKAQCLYAHYLEKRESRRLGLLQDAAERALAMQQARPDSVNAHYFYAYALGRYGQAISVAKALEQGLGFKVKTALERCIVLQPRHADAHIALGSFHAEVIDKVGTLLGLAQGADAATGLRLFRQGLKLNPHSAVAMMEMANGLVMLEGEKRMAEAERLYADAAAFTPADASERLDVEAAKAELED